MKYRWGKKSLFGKLTRKEASVEYHLDFVLNALISKPSPTGKELDEKTHSTLVSKVYAEWILFIEISVSRLLSILFQI